MNAFTVIELLVVVAAILLCLTGLLLPVIARARNENQVEQKIGAKTLCGKIVVGGRVKIKGTDVVGEVRGIRTTVEWKKKGKRRKKQKIVTQTIIVYSARITYEVDGEDEFEMDKLEVVK